MAENFDKLMSIFQEALEKHSPESWDEFVRQASEGDEQLNIQVCQLLESHAHGGSLLDKPAVTALPTLDQPITEAPGTVIGPYKLLQQIGEGGMGVVYMAEQAEPVERRVALKIIRPGMDTRQVIARFEAERQALAMMDHPNISKVFDAGTTDTGRPYFVMELVKGVPITQYCDEHHLSPRERLELFVPVCQAVQHAHQKGIIHRDIKPSNVMVAEYDNRPAPKIIDFGVAKAVEQRLTEKTMFTQLGQVIGTIDYMSPEQAKLNQLDIDTRSDIYSLGVLLYELLTGETPLDRERLRSAAFDEMLRIIREEEPQKPSLRLSSSHALPSIAANRHIEPKKLSTLVRGELDWIVMKALEKDRTRRYETANGFALDVQRYLVDEPIAARPPSAAYRFRKLARRNRGLLAAILVVSTVLLAGTVVSVWQAFRATRAEKVAQTRLIAAQQAHQEAHEAERNAMQRLFDSHLAEAKSLRWSGRPGQRIDAIQAISKASKLIETLGLGEGSKRALRDEAIAAIAMGDLREERCWKGRRNTETGVALSSGFELFAAEDRLAEVPHVAVHRVVEPTTELLRIPIGQARSCYAAFGPAGRTFLVGNQSGKSSVWEIETRKKLLTVPESGEKWSRHLSPDGKMLAVGQSDGAVDVYDLFQGSLVCEHPPLASKVRIVKFSPDGQRLAVVQVGSSKIEIRNTLDGKTLSSLSASGGTVHSIAWHPEGERMAAGCWQEINIWDLSDAAEEPMVIAAHESLVSNIEFHPGGEMLVSDSWDGRTRLWNAQTGDRVLEYLGSFTGFSRDGRRLGFYRGLDLGFWEVVEAEAVHWLYHERVRDTAISPDGRLLAVSTNDDIGLWDLAAGKQIARLPTGWSQGVLFDPSDGSLVTSSLAGTHVWPIRSDGEAQPIRLGPPRPFAEGLSQPGYISLSRDGQLLIIDHSTGSQKLWKASLVKKGSPASEFLELSRLHLYYVAISPDGKGAATGNKWGQDVDIWDASTGEHVRELTSYGSATVAFSPDNRWVVTNSGEAVRFWEVGTWRLSHTFPASSAAGSAIAFSADSRLAAIAREGQGLLLVDAQTGAPLATLEMNARRPRIESISFSPDGSQIVVGMGEAGMCVWDLPLIRKRLSQLGLDWDQPPTAQPQSSPEPGPLETGPIEISVDLRDFAQQKEAR